MEEIAKMGYDKRDIDILTRAWDPTGEKPMKCPKCGKHMIIVQVEPVYDAENAYVPFDTIIECTSTLRTFHRFFASWVPGSSQNINISLIITHFGNFFHPLYLCRLLT